MAKRMRTVLRIELLEAKVVPTVTALTNLDPQFYGDTGFGLSTLTAMPAQTQSMSADGQLVVFESAAADLVPHDRNYQKDVFLYDRGRGTVRLISENFLGTNSVNAGASNPVISPDGRYVAFQSQATDVVSGVNGAKIYLYDLQTNTMSVASQSTANVLNNNTAQLPLFTGDSQHLLYVSNATNLDASVTIVTGNNLFWRDLNTGENKMVTVALNGTTSGGLNNGAGVYPWYNFSASSNGRYVAFVGNTDTFTANDANGLEDVFRRDMQLGTTQLVSVDTSGGFSANQHSSLNVNSISDDGQKILFRSDASNLVAGDVNGVGDLFLRDLSGTPTTIAVSVNSTGTMVGGLSGVLTPDGKYVAFVSNAANLLPGITGQNVYRRDLQAGTTVLASRTPSGTGGNAASGTSQYFYDFSVGTPLITPDGRYIAYASEATNLAGTDSNNAQASNVNRRDLFRADLTTNTNTLISTISGTTTGGNSASQSPAMSTDGRFFAFESLATNLVPGTADSNALGDVFVHDATSHLTEIASLHSPFLDDTVAINASVDYTLDTSPDGRYVLFTTTSKALTPAIPGVWFHSNSFVRDTVTGTVEAVSLLPNNTMNGVTAQFGSISADGRFVVFVSSDPNYDASNTYSTGGVFLRDRQTGTNRLISRNTTTDTAVTGNIGEVTISRDGRYVAFTHTGQTMVNGVTYPLNDYNLFVYDRLSDTTRMVSVSPDGTTAGNTGIEGFHYDYRPRFSADGSKLVYVTNASNLVAGVTDTNGRGDVFVYDTTTQANDLVSVSTTAGVAGNLESNQYDRPTISADGRYVAFTSNATNLTAIAGGNRQTYRRDLQTGTTILVSVNTAGTGVANNPAEWPQISADGNKMFFESYATNMTATPTSGFRQVFMRDLSGSPTTTLVSKNTAGTAGANGDVFLQAANRYDPMDRVSDDGRYVTYKSSATNLVADFAQPPTNTDPDVYVSDVQTGRTALSAWSITGTAAANEGAGLYMLPGAAGPTVIFNSYADDLTAGDRVGSGGSSYQDIFATTVNGNASISGTVFHDVDGNGTQNSESGFGYWTVFLDTDNDGVRDPSERNALTDANGNYRFTNMAAGNYTVRVKLAADHDHTTATSHSVTLATDTSVETGKHFGAKVAIPDVAVTALTFDGTNLQPGDTRSLTATLANLSNTRIASGFQNALYLSTDATLDGSDVLLTTATYLSRIEALATVQQTFDFTMPRIAPGTYHLLFSADRRRQIGNEVNRTNNTFASSPLALTIPLLAYNIPANSAFATAQPERFFQFTTVANEAVTVHLDSAALTGQADVFVAWNRVPTPADFDIRTTGTPDQTLTIPHTQAGTYYVLARGRSGAALNANFSIEADLATFGLQTIAPFSGGNTGSVTIALHGTKFTPSTQAQLVLGDTTLNAANVVMENESLLYATFDLAGQTLGAYDVRVVDDSNTASLNATFTVEEGVSEPVALKVLAPMDVRSGREASMVVEYTNTSNTDITAPLLTLTATNAKLRLAEEQEWGASTIAFLGIAPEGPAGVLRPGQTGTVRFAFQSTSPTNEQIDFTVRRLTSAKEALNWTTQQSVMKPGHIPADAWDAIIGNVVVAAGNTAGSYEQMLATNANYLSSLGQRTASALGLLAFEIAKADSSFAAGSLASVNEVSFPAPELSLNFTRYHVQSIHGRYTVGAFGRGWAHNWDNQSLTLPSGDVIIRTGSARRFFAKQDNGTYRGESGDTGQLVLAAGKYTLTDDNSTIWVFRVDGLLDYVEGDNNQRITAGYDGLNRLTTLTHTNGKAITLEYNTANRLTKLTDPVGREVTYTYDDANQHLLSYTDRWGTHTYTYATEVGAAREHALTSINFSDDTHLNFTYDSHGRLVREERDGGTIPTIYTYLPGGGYIVRDGLNNGTTILQDRRGFVRKTIDPLGRVATFDYDKRFNLSATNLEEGVRYVYEYDDRGNLIASTDGMGRTTGFTYDDRDNLTSYTDALGRTRSYTYDGEDNLTKVTDAAGKDELFVYDAFGNVQTRTNRRGNDVTYTFNANGQPLTKTYADSSVVTYGYDAHARLQTLTDTSGTITLQYNADDSLQKITYADGKFLSFQYNIVSQRTQSVDQDGFIVNTSYDDLGRVQELTDGANARIVKYTYDAAGRLSREDKGNGTATVYDFDAAGQVTKITHLKPDSSVNTFVEYDYDRLGRRTSMTTPDGLTSYTYDPSGQLTHVTLPGGRTIEYVYDAVGNRMQVIDSQLGTTAYTSNDMNEYLTMGSAAYAYDDDGNLTSKTDGSGTTTYTYNDENRLTGVTAPGLTASYGYNAFGHRTRETVNGQVTNFLIDPMGLGNIVAEYDATNTTIAKYTHGYGLVNRVGATTSYYDFDVLGNTLGMTDAAGAYANRYSYLPFGETTTISAGVANAFTFVGAFGVRADVAGTFNMRRRNYDVSLGQFMANDPLDLAAGSGNLRGYVDNAPTNDIDPTGLISETEKANAKTGLPTGCGAYKGLNSGPGWNQIIFTGSPAPVDVRYDIVDDSDPKNIYYRVGGFMGFGGEIYVHKGDTANSTAGSGNGATSSSAASSAGGASSSGAAGGSSGGSCPCGCPPGGDGGGGASGTPGAASSSRPLGSFDPNDITGPAGFGPENYLPPGQTMPYVIRFENQATATAPAQEVFITHQLDADLDWNTLELGTFGWGGIVVTVPAGVDSYSKRVSTVNAMSGNTPLFVDITATLNRTTGIVSWILRSLDPTTGLLPEGVLDGFLPPNDSTHRGEGFVEYKIRAKSNLTTGTTIDQQASIVFDTNTPILTNIFTNTIDADAPTVTLNPVPPTATRRQIDVTWSGADVGAGLAGYDVFVATDEGAFEPWLTNTLATSATFAGKGGHTYQFRVQASDNAQYRTITLPQSTQIAATANRLFKTIKEDTTKGKGLTAMQLLGTWFNDFNTGGKRGVAITGMAGDGTWQFSLNGKIWTNLAAVATTNALLLSGSQRVRFIPTVNSSGTATVDYVAWDLTNGTAGQYVDSTSLAANFSTLAERAYQEVMPVNDAPVLVTTKLTALPSMALNAPATLGISVGELLAGRASDVENANLGAAVTSVSGKGTWEYCLDGFTWFTLKGVSAGKARLLDESSRVRFTPALDFVGTAQLGYRAWDRTTGSVGAAAKVKGTAFSKATEYAQVSVGNAAPVLDNSGSPTLGSIVANTTKYSGHVVKTFLGTSIKDTPKAKQGIAITGLTGDGTWQYQSGGKWLTISANPVAALLLSDTSKIRFIPTANTTGTATITYRAWDQSVGKNGEWADTTANMLNAFSVLEETAVITINPS